MRTIAAGLLTIGVVLVFAVPTRAEPAWTRNGDCTACHGVARPGLLTVINEDLWADPSGAGPRRVFRATPGSTKALYADVTGMAPGDKYAVVAKQFKYAGLHNNVALRYNADCDWADWGGGPGTSTDTAFFAEATGQPYLARYDIGVRSDAAVDHYDLIYAVAGRAADGSLFYDEEHFYLEVATSVPTGPQLSVSATALAPQAMHMTNPADATFTVRNAGVGTLAYEITDDADWVSVEPSAGTCTTNADTITIRYAAAALLPGAHPATITVNAPGAASSPQTIHVTLTITPVGADLDADGDVDLSDFTFLQICFNGPNRPTPMGSCSAVDGDNDGDVDLADFSRFLTCFNGPNRPPAAGCMQ